MTYLLILSVLGLWGLIFYRVADNVNKTPGIVSVPGMKMSPDKGTIFSQQDTFTLLLNYRDPFTGEIMKEPVEESKTPVLNLPLSKPEPVKLNNIVYMGYINNPGSKRAVSIMKIDGKEQMMIEGETLGDLKLLRNSRDSVQVNYKGKKYFIIKN